jgi:5-methylcytosine-specific restriction endonuclease McrA
VSGTRPCTHCGAEFTVFVDYQAQTTCGISCAKSAAFLDARRIRMLGASTPVHFPTCTWCGDLFTARQRNAVRCLGPSCTPPARPAVTVTCSECGEPFVTTRWTTRPDSLRFCSRQCSHRHHGRNARHRRRQRTRTTGVNVSRAAVFARDGWRCQLCGRKVRRDVNPHHPLAPSIDHIVPLSAGGRHEPGNVQTAHMRCNIVRGAVGPAQLRWLP